MYSLDSAYGVSVQANSHWGAANVGTLPFNQVFNAYRRLYMTLSTPFLTDPIHVDFEIFRAEYSNDTRAVSDVLADLDNNALQTVPQVPQYQLKSVRYADAHAARYYIDATAEGLPPSPDIPTHARNEVRLYRPHTDMQKFYENCMVTVNGYFHMTDTDGKYVYVYKGGESRNHCHQATLGILNFEDLGGVRQIRITEDMIFAQGSNSFTNRKIYLDLKEDFSGKTVMLVIGGYLYFLETGIFQQIGDTTYLVDFNHVPIIERFIESSKYLDLSALPLEYAVNNPESFVVADFFKDETIKAYFTLPQSFAVVVPTEKLSAQRHYLQHSSHAGMYIAYQDMKLPMFVGYGRCADYWKRKNAGQWSINVDNSERDNLVWRSFADPRQKIATPARIPAKTHYNSQGYMLTLNADILVE